MLISYAQNFEDVILWRALKDVERGFYIDVGAQDPVVDSVSLAFHERGWRGVHVEPIGYYAGKLRSARPYEEVIEAAIGAGEAAIPFFEITDTGLSTGDETIAHEHEVNGYRVRRIDVPCLPLSKILDAHKDRPIHWLKIDVEGMEKQVLESWVPSPVRPWVVVVESTKPNSPGPNFVAWEPQLVALGYEFVYFDGLNRFYASVEHPELKAAFGPGPNCFDDFALSGLASAPFCHKINTEASSLRQEVAGRAEEVAQLTRSLDAARAEAAALISEIALKNEVLTAREREIARLHQRIAEMDAWGQAAIAHEIAVKNEALAAREREVARLHQRIAEMDAWGQVAIAHEKALKQQLAALYSSISWRVTAPLRFVSRGATRGVRGARAWITLKPESRLRRAARRMFAGLTNRLSARPPLSTATISPGDAQRTILLAPGQPDLSAEPDHVRRLYLRLVQMRDRISDSG